MRYDQIHERYPPTQGANKQRILNRQWRTSQEETNVPRRLGGRFCRKRRVGMLFEKPIRCSSYQVSGTRELYRRPAALVAGPEAIALPRESSFVKIKGFNRFGT